MNNQSEREKIAAKIKALLALAAENSGTTESEMMAAALKARELMAKHSISMTEAEILSEGFQEETLKEEDKKRGWVRGCLDICVAEFTGTKIWGSSDRKEFKFFGLTSDVIFATFLHDSLSDFVLRNADAFAEKQLVKEAESMGVPLSRARRLFAPQMYRWWESFVTACTKRIGERLMAARKDTQVKGTTGAALVVLDKRKLVTDELKARGITLRTVKIKTEKADASGLVAGKAAGDAAGFDKPVNDGRKPVGMLPNGRNKY